MAFSPPQLEVEAPDTRTPHLRNTLDVLHVLQRKSPVTSLELAKDTRLSRGTIAAIIRRLSDQHLIELEPLHDEVSSSSPNGGRPANRLRLRRDAAVALSIEIGLRHVCVALGNLAGLTTTPVSSFDVAGDAPAAIETAVVLVQQIMADGGVQPEDLIGVCVGLPAPIDQKQGRIASTAGIASWTGIRPADELRYRLGAAWQNVPFTLENDANLVALAEFAPNIARDSALNCQDVVLVVKWSDGLGGALLINGELVTGDRGLAFELGHTPAGDSSASGEPCYRCGHVCLETLAGGEAIAGALNDSGAGRSPSFSDVVQLAVEADGAERVALRSAARRIGEALGAFVTLLNPRLIVISGRHFGESPHDVAAYRVIADPIREGMRSTGLPCALEDVDIVLGKNSAIAAAEGGIVAALRRMLPSYLEQRA